MNNPPQHISSKHISTQHTLQALGSSVTYSQAYAPQVLESVPNPHPHTPYFIKFNCPEFTSLCPITGQPDFATIYISYIPDASILESKSLKLYLFSFRNHGAFHEDCVNLILRDINTLLTPHYIEVWGKFLPRGGISIDPYCNYGKGEYSTMARRRLMYHDLYPESITNR